MLRALATTIYDEMMVMGIKAELYGPLVICPPKPRDFFVIHWAIVGTNIGARPVAHRVAFYSDYVHYIVSGLTIRTFEYCDPAFPDDLYQLVRLRC